MEIEFTHQYTTGSGKVYQVGDIDHVENSVAAKLFFEGIAKRPVYKTFKEAMDAKEKHRQATLSQTAQIPATVQWGVSKGVVSDRWLISARCSRPNCSTLQYTAPPSQAVESIKFLHSCGCASGPETIPAAVAAQYKKLYAAPMSIGADEANYYRNAQPDKTDNRPMDLSMIVGPQKGNG